MAEEKRPRGFLKRFEERLDAGPQNSPEEIARFKKERKSAFGTSREWAEMQTDLTIARNSVQYLPDGTRGHGASSSAPGDPGYEELCNLHNLKKPGDASTICKRLIDDAWVVVDDLE